jgi:hypothetical protein
MCDESAATVVAPLPALPADSGEISTIACAWFETTNVDRVHPGVPWQQKSASDQPSDLLAVLKVIAAPSSLGFVAVQWCGDPDGHPRREHRSGVYRPPATA